MCVPYNANAFEFDWTEINKFYFGYKPGYLYARIHAVGGIGSTIKSDKYTHFLQFDTILSPITQPLKCSTGNQAIKKINATCKGAPPYTIEMIALAHMRARHAQKPNFPAKHVFIEKKPYLAFKSFAIYLFLLHAHARLIPLHPSSAMCFNFN